MEIEIKPDNFETTIQDCPSGLFLFKDSLCFKSSYNEIYLCSGSAFWGGVETREEMLKLRVIPLRHEIIE